MAASGKPRPKKKAKPPALPKRGRGQPLTFTPAVGKAIVEIVREHGFDYLAAETIGVHRDTVADWRDRGKAGDQIFADFYIDLMQAKAEYIVARFKKIDAHKDWKAQAFVLERLDRSLAQATRVEHSGRDGAPIQIAHTLTPEQAAEFRKSILGVAAPSTDEGTSNG